MRLFPCFPVVFLLSSVCAAQLTNPQKRQDFHQLAALYNKQYAPYEWKKQLYGFDLLDLRPWLPRVEQARDDMEFYDICIEYVASLRDGHSVFTLPSNFVARLPFHVDIYDGKVLFDGITRSQMPEDQYPIQLGEELLSMDGKPVEQLLQQLARYNVIGTPRGNRRAAASLLTFRSQARIPSAPALGPTANILVRHKDGTEASYDIAWTRTGLPLRTAGKVPDPRTADGLPLFDREPPHRRLLQAMQNDAIAADLHEVLNVGRRPPHYRLPDGFQLRLGRSGGDNFYSGLFTAEGFRIGFIRIPDFAPPNTRNALTQFSSEVFFMEQNTDALVVDVTRNPGGSVCYGEELVRMLTPYLFRGTHKLYRASSMVLANFASAVAAARQEGEEEWVVNLLQSHLDAVQIAHAENRGLTGPMPTCEVTELREPLRLQNGQTFGYSRPILLLADDYSLSMGDLFTALLQDAARVVVFGYRTGGLGGSVLSFNAGHFSEGLARVTWNLSTRKDPVITSEYPAAALIENIGVQPDIYYDYMTVENLQRQGRPFVEAFTKAIVEQIRLTR